MCVYIYIYTLYIYIPDTYHHVQSFKAIGPLSLTPPACHRSPNMGKASTASSMDQPFRSILVHRPETAATKAANANLVG